MQRVVFREKIPVFLAAYKFFPPKNRLKSLRQVKIFIQKKLLSTTKTWKNTPVLTLILNSWNQTSKRKTKPISARRTEVEESWDKLVMQCFLVVYCEYPTRDLIFLFCTLRKIKSLVGYFTVYHSKALHN